MTKKLIINRDELYDLYRVQKLEIKLIAEMYGCTRNCIWSRLKSYRIKTWSMAEHRKHNHWGISGKEHPTKRLDVRLKMIKNHADFNGKKNPNYNNHVLAGKNNPNWQGGISDKGYPWYWNNALKRRIKERDNYTCQECGIKDKESVEVHHIDFNKGNCEDWNLLTLCKRHNIQANYKREFFTKKYSDLIKSKYNSIYGDTNNVRFNLDSKV